MKRYALVSVSLLVLLSSCSDTPTVIPARNLERPSDMGFLCLATVQDGNGTEVLTGQPMRVCQPAGACAQATASNSCPGLTSPRTLGTFAVVTNTSRGELSVVDLDRNRLVDLDPIVPGFGTVPVGTMPESLAASQDGCWVATANRQSCDLALIDPSRLLSPLFNDVGAASGAGAVVTRIQPTTASGRVLRAAPGEVAFLPTTEPAQLCSATQAPRALVTFPNCNLLALLDLPSGRILDSYYIQAGGAVRAGAEPECANDCLGTLDGGAAPSPADASLVDAGAEDAGQEDDSGASDAAAMDNAGSATAGPLGVSALAVSPDGTRVYVGSSQLPFISVFDLQGAALVDRGRLLLAGNAVGVDRLRLTVDPFKPRVENGQQVGQGDFLDNRGRFVYAFARDASVRVVQLDSTLANGIGRECDVNIEPSEANKAVLRQTLGVSGLTETDPVTGLPDPFSGPCIPVGTPGATRRPLASGPGITIPVLSSQDVQPPLARDIAFAELDVPEANWLSKPQGLTGQFGFLLASNGTVYVTNLAPNPEPLILRSNEDPDPAKFALEFIRSTATHAFREARSTGYAGARQPTTYTAPLRVQNASDLLFATTASLSPTQGPYVDSITLSANQSATGNIEHSWAAFPDPTSPVSHRWTIVWEELLPQTSRDSGTVLPGAENLAGTLIDAGGDFCSHSVLAGDLVVMPGCLKDTDCVPQDEFVCRRVSGGVRGLCLPKDSAAGKPLVQRCTRLLNSRRRYEIQTATPTQLTLGLKLDDVSRPPLSRQTLDECAADTDCYVTSAHRPSGADWPDGQADPGFQCLQIQAGGPRRCVKRCPAAGSPQGDNFCRPGNVCESVPGVLPEIGPLCVEAPPVDTACWPQPSVTYNVHAGRSFVVTGSSLPRTPTAKTVGGQCVRDTSVPPDRIPLSAPFCTSFQDDQPAQGNQPGQVNTPPEASLSIDRVVAPDPCLLMANVTLTNGTALGIHTKAVFQNTQIRFVLTNLEQYGGDGLGFRLDVSDGVTPETVLIPSYDIMLSQGVRIVVGPTRTPESPFRQSSFVPVEGQPPFSTQYPYLYLVDQGRTALSSSLSPARGQILRINPRRSSDAYAAFSPAVTGSATFQIQ